MRISARCEYACRAMLELALRFQSGDPVNSTLIAERRGIPEKYLVHILLQLKRSGLVQSVRGAQGGYLLAQAPNTVTLYDIVTAIDGPIEDQLPLGDDASAELRPAWNRVAQGLKSSMQKILLNEIAENADKPDMYYI
ncbi:MAG: Rrf2 family transcriptional regulator [Candidatus Hydrogenedens sp.]|nr:Rrf2 family transcriptional regulator [Candidatus Hydrogenedens sp.]